MTKTNLVVVKETSKDINLAVPFIAQSPPGDWDNTRNCGPTSYLMIYTYYKNTIPTVQDIKNLDDWLFENEDLPINNYNGSYTTCDILKRLSINHGGFSETEVHRDWTMEGLISELQKGYPVIVAVRLRMSSKVTTSNGHFMVLRGIDQNYVYVNDPGRSLGSGHGKNKKYSKQEFVASWNTQGRACVTIHSELSGGGGSDHPLNLVSEIAQNKIVLGWDHPVSELPLSYQILRNGNYIKSVESNNTYYTDTSVVAGVLYCYTVKSEFEENLSGPSNEICIELSNDSDEIDLENGLVAYYPFNGNANDESGNGNHGVVNGNLQYENGILDKAARFDEKDYISINKPEALNTVETMTISYWLKYFKPVSGPDDVYAIVWNKERTIFTYAGSTSISHHLSETPESNSVNVSIPVEAKIPLDNQHFYLVTFVVTEKKLKTYKNGEFISESERKDISLSKLSDNWFIGQSGSNTYYLDGNIDELRFYNRALNSLEVKQLYKQGIKTTYPLTEIQSLPVGGYNSHIESFTINNETFIAVGNGKSTKIYKWINSSFVEFQSIETYSSSQITSFVIDGINYLAIANRGNSSNPSVDSNIYIWNGKQFEIYQSLSKYDCLGLEFFSINNEHFLVVSNYGDNENGSHIFKWSVNSFQLFQSLPTKGAIRSKYFTINEESYLAIASHYFSGFNQNSTIYKWNGSYFEEFQNIQTSGVWDIESFSIGNDKFLAIANSFNGISNDIDSIIYQWDGQKFIKIQAILTHGAADWEFFTYNNNSYLIVANSDNYYRLNQDFSTISVVYKWYGGQFQKIQSFNLYRNYDWETFFINNEIYFAGNSTSASNGTNIYKWNYELTVKPSFQTIADTSGSIVIKITSNNNWTASTEDSWLTIIANENNTITVYYDSNNGEERTGEIIVSPEGGKDTSQIIKLKQKSANTNLENGLVAYYPFNGNAKDESGNENHGIVYGASSTEDRFGNHNSALSFDGTDDYIDTNISDILLPNNSWSVCLWVNKNLNNGYNGIFNKIYKDNNGVRLHLYGENNEEVIKYMLFGNDWKIHTINLQSNTNSDLEWNFIVTQWDHNTKTAKLFVDNIFVGDETINWASEFNNSKSIQIGIAKQADYDYSLYYFNGFIDDVRIYNRAISEIEIKALYEQDLSTFTITPLLKNITSFAGTTSFSVNTNQNWTASTTNPWLTIQTSSDTITVIHDTNTGEERTGTISVVAEDSANSEEIIVIKQESGLIDLDKGLIAYYPFNGNANDESENSNHGSVNGATLTEDRFANSSKAYYFDGENDYINIKDNDRFETVNVKTISLWINKTGTRSIYSNYGVITKYKSDTFNESGWILRCPTDNDTTYINGAYKGIANSSAIRIQLNTWYLMTLTLTEYNSLYNLRLFLNGKEVDSILASIENDNYLKDSTNDILIGACFGKTGNISQYSYFYGIIDDVRIYNRALSSIEIQSLYNFSPNTTLSITPKSKEVSFDSGATTIIVNSNVNWNATATAPWLTIQSDQNTITAIYDENLGNIRTAIITVSAEGTSLSPQYIEITQTQVLNNPPVANNQEVTTNTNVPVNISLSATDIDNDPLIFSILQPPSHGTISNKPPNIIYTPNQNYEGTDEFTFKANDGKEDSNIATVSIQINPIITTRHFKEVDGNPADDTWTIYLSSATLDGEDLQPNDEIAIFNNETLVGSFKISEILSDTNQLKNYLTAWSTLSDGNGYQAGQPYTFKCWDISHQKEYTCFNPVFTNPYDDAFTGDVFPDGDGKYSIVSLDFLTSIKQTIELSKGYQFVSLNIQPDETEMTKILSSTLNEIDFAKDSKGNMLRKIGPNWVNNIGRWKKHKRAIYYE
ncbi:MAG: hypothetical protein OMM_03594 [Candidatus Magnetoglobus multicellularis str. Araruama]|uniref:Peptidase C39-like domain-containing protein n=1 Tax=Candidatus Magnetoglobus multicellularis str. Araruama TaxID=890399 RepID=A0A1V1P562_9BACT|nr:MAG: hypothetical protein OMM_03594 [Candidatus Magnetoglobus multicellularis str. Araruama]